MPAIFSAFSGDTTSAGLSVLLILGKATVVLLAALGVTRVMERGSAISRHLVWFVSLGALLLIPMLASWSPIRLAILPSDMAPPTAAPAANSRDANVQATVNTVRDIVSPNTAWFGVLRNPKLLLGIWATV